MNQTNTPSLVVVLGMHRSGTSLCSNILHLLGIPMAGSPGAGPANARGHWERGELIAFNDRILGLYGRRWEDPGHKLAMPPHYLADPRVHALRDQAAAWLRALAGREAAGLGMKDPRVTRLLPFWDAVFRDAGLAPRFVLCVRHPAQVARSLAARDKLPAEEAEWRWLAYTLAAVSGIGDRPVCIIPYEDWFTRGPATIGRLADWVGADAARAPAALGAVAEELRHDGAAEAGPLVTRLFDALVAEAGSNHLSLATRAVCDWLMDAERQAQPLLTRAEVLRRSVGDQGRVIADLTAELNRLRGRPAA